MGFWGEAATIWLTTGSSTDVRTNVESSQRWLDLPRLMRFWPWTKTTRLGS